MRNNMFSSLAIKHSNQRRRSRGDQTICNTIALLAIVGEELQLRVCVSITILLRLNPNKFSEINFL